MNQSYFIVELAHSAHGQFKRIHITPRLLKGTLCGAAVFGVLITALLTACVWMSWKLTDYYKITHDLQSLRGRYSELQSQAKERKQQMVSLEKLAGEVSAAYGLRNRTAAEDGGAPLDDDLSPVHESIEQFNFLKSASYSTIYHQYAHEWQSNSQPSAWPVNGLLRSAFGGRSDPFSGEGAFHTGIDLSATTGTPVHVTGDGVVVRAGWDGRYGKLVVIDHGSQLQTYYAHLSEFLVVPGQEVRKGEEIALSGGTGRATSPHLHYEVRVAGSPVNPYRYLPKAQVAVAGHPAHDDLGL